MPSAYNAPSAYNVAEVPNTRGNRLDGQIQLISQDVVQFAIDAGGTATRMTIYVGGAAIEVSGLPVLNTGSVEEEVASDGLLYALEKIVRVARDAHVDPKVDGIVASAAISLSSLSFWTNRVTRLLRLVGATGHVIVTNDVVPLLLGSPLFGVGAVLTVGTGSCVMGSDLTGLPFRVGGLEYLGSDEGSAFYIGRLGLIASIWASERRGAPTTIRARYENVLTLDIASAALQLARLPFPKVRVAQLAMQVLLAWLEDSDPVAESIVVRAVSELESMVHCAAVMMPSNARSRWVLSGGLAVQCLEFARRIETMLRTTVDTTHLNVTVVEDCREAGRSVLSRGIVPHASIPWAQVRA